MTVVIGSNFQATQLWRAQDVNEKWRIGRLITQDGKRYIVQNGVKYQVKPNTKPKAYN